ncbi:MAG TPA: NADP-dependent oxidoreductase [Pseudonocardiaceae bacterium]
MQAVVVREFGGPEALRLVEVPAPKPGPGQVVVTIAAAAVNPVDAFTRFGGFPDLAGLGRDIGIGWDVAGVIAEVGPGVTGYAVGDAVIGMRDRLALPTGAYAEQIALDAAHIAPAPRGVDLAAAATIPLNGLTAVQGLDLLAAPAGSTVLITGAAGALGGYLVELAAGRGLRVLATASAADEEVVRGWGAEVFIPRTADLAGAVRQVFPGGVDAVLDAAVLGMPALDTVRGNGSFVHFGGAVPRGLRGIRVVPVSIREDGDALRALSTLAGLGRLTLRVAETLPLTDAAKAHELLAGGGLRGRLVLRP